MKMPSASSVTCVCVCARVQSLANKPAGHTVLVGKKIILISKIQRKFIINNELYIFLTKRNIKNIISKNVQQTLRSIGGFVVMFVISWQRVISNILYRSDAVL